jgi:glycosyltransferase involved in cell wall biosynthesis
MTPRKPKIALWFRYGPAEHAELFHAIPDIVSELARHAEVHYYGMKSRRTIPPAIEANAVLHHLPFFVNRTVSRDKSLKALLWVLSLPFVALHCRLSGVQVVYVDETVPLTASIARVFFGRRVVFTVADFFPEIYFGRSLLFRPLVHLLRFLDLWGWRRMDLIFTRAKTTRNYLTAKGVPSGRIQPVYDPCDFASYHPADHNQARGRYGYTGDEIVLVHHGILHPNKGNDRILKALADLKPVCPQLRYLLVGDGPETARLRTLSRELRITDVVRLTGWLPDKSDVNDALNAGDIGLVMRVGEQSDDFHMTGALVHNMACGLPILAARLGGVSEVISENDAGLLFDPNNMEEFKSKLLSLAGDAGLRQRLGRRASELAHQHFDMPAVTRQTVQPLLALAGIATA